METQPSEGSRTVPAGLDTLRGLPWDLPWELLFPSGSLVLTPGDHRDLGNIPWCWHGPEQSKQPPESLPLPSPHQTHSPGLSFPSCYHFLKG